MNKKILRINLMFYSEDINQYVITQTIFTEDKPIKYLEYDIMEYAYDSDYPVTHYRIDEVPNINTLTITKKGNTKSLKSLYNKLN